MSRELTETHRAAAVGQNGRSMDTTVSARFQQVPPQPHGVTVPELWDI